MRLGECKEKRKQVMNANRKCDIIVIQDGKIECWDWLI